jgi:hypothetical protein
MELFLFSVLLFAVYVLNAVYILLFFADNFLVKLFAFFNVFKNSLNSVFLNSY